MLQTWKGFVVLLSSVALAAGGTVPASRQATLAPAAPARDRAREALAGLPLAFEANRGQFDRLASFRVRGEGYTAFFTDAGPAWSLAPETPAVGPPASAGASLRMEVLGGARVSPEGLDRLRGTMNYFLGDDPAGWHRGVPTFGRVRYPDVYPGIDLTFRSDPGRTLEYVFRLAPGTDPRRIVLGLPGAEALRLDGHGNLIVLTPAGPLRHTAPFLYQPGRGGRRPIDGGFVLRGSRVGFAVGPYDHGLPLVIDPAADLAYSTFLGGTLDDNGTAIAVDGSGNAFVTGWTDNAATDLPTTTGAYDGTHNGTDDAFVAKINPAGGGATDLAYSTFLGGDFTDKGSGVAVDGSGNAFVTGWTSATNFPTTSGAYDTSHNGDYDAFVAKVTPAGGGATDLAYSTYLGGSGSDTGAAVAVDGSGNALVTGDTSDATTDLPTTAGAYDTGHNGSADAFVAKINPAGGGATDLAYSTFLGGNNADAGTGIAVDGSGKAFVTGYTYNFPSPPTPLPTTSGAYDGTHNGVQDAFVAKINPAGGGATDLAYSTFLGGSGVDQGLGIAVDGSGNALVTGYTQDTGTNLPATPGAYDTVHNGGPIDAFLAEINPAGGGATDLAYSTFLGGSGNDYGYAIALDASGNAFVTGTTPDATTDLPTTPGAYDTTPNGFDDVFLAEITPTGGGTIDLPYSTFLGGSGNDYGKGVAVDVSGNAFVTGWTGNAATDLPTTPGAYDTAHNGGDDAFVAKISLTFQPDGLIRLGSGSDLGDGVYNTDGTDQTISTKAKRGQTKTFTITVQSEGSVGDSFELDGPGSTSKFSVKYFSGTTNVTSLVTAGTFSTAVLAAGGSEELTLKIKPKNAANVGNKKSVLVTATSATDLSAQDAVKAKVTVKAG